MRIVCSILVINFSLFLNSKTILCQEAAASVKPEQSWRHKPKSIPFNEGRFLFSWDLNNLPKSAEKQLPAHLEAKVIGVPDGNTLIVLHKQRPLRLVLAASDAPERTQYYGNEAQQQLSNRVYLKTVYLQSQMQVVDEQSPVYVFDAGGNVNVWLIESGLAWCRQDSFKLCDQKQAVAKHNKIGLWQQDDPLPPWQYRHLVAIQRVRPNISRVDWRKNNKILSTLKMGQATSDYKHNEDLEKPEPYTKPLPKKPR